MQQGDAGNGHRAGRYPADEAIFRRARQRLTAWYVAALAVIVIAFSIVLYVAFASDLPPRGDAHDVSPRYQAERDASDFALGRLRLLLVTGNLILLAGAAGGAYFLAGKTLMPVAAALARQRRFATDASHELRTPLTVMRGTVGVTLQRERTAADYRAVLEEVDEEVTALTGLVEQLLQLARGAAITAPAGDGAAVQEVLAEVVRATRDLASQHRSSVVVAPGPGLRTRMDAAALRHICLNLVVNALRHTPPGTAVRVEAAQHGMVITITVIDNGPGIPPAEQERIFEPFYRLAPAASPGAGLGLALVHELVTGYGGEITVAEHAGGGATFCVRLPAAAR